MMYDFFTIALCLFIGCIAAVLIIGYKETDELFGDDDEPMD